MKKHELFLCIAAFYIVTPTVSHPRSLAQIPKATNHSEWFTAADYPIAAQMAWESGTVEFRITIDARGMPTACVVTKSSNSAILDNATCSLVMQRARFSPAADDDGTPSQGMYFDKVRWTLPSQGIPYTVTPTNSVIEFDVGDTGMIQHCAVHNSASAEEAAFCNTYDRIAVPMGTPRLRNVHVTVKTNVEISAVPATSPPKR